MEKLAVMPQALASPARVMRVQSLTPDVRLRCDSSGEQLHADEVAVQAAPLQCGDKVLVQPTLQGWVITALLEQTATRPINVDNDGRLVLSCEQGIRLQVGDARIDISADGCITVDGQEVHTLASGLQRILGATVQIN